MNDQPPRVLFNASQVAQATGGQLVQGDSRVAVATVNTDSRTPAPGSLFMALRGERFDGARFCQAAVAGGAAAVLVERSSFEAGLCGQLPWPVAVIAVADGLRALGDLAAWHRRRYAARLVAVTGSNGKTSTKEMTASVLGKAPEVLYNRGNFNNLVGMPRALLQLGPEHRYAVMEMGMNAPGEIARLAEVAGPQLAVITNVHPVHLAGLGSLEAIAQAKGELLDELDPSGTAVLNADDPYVLKQAGRTRALRVTFGRSPAADVRIESLRQASDGLSFRLLLGPQAIEVRLARLGLHNALNAAAAAAVGMVEGLAGEIIQERLAQAPAPPMRMEIIDLGSAKLLADCYNANPRSVQAAVDSLAQLPRTGARLALLGDMLELGDSSAQLHQQVGRLVAEAGLDGLCAFGPLAKDIATGARAAGLQWVLHTESFEEALDWARRQLEPGSWMLLKGSRGMRMERIVSALAQDHGIDWGRQEEH